MNRTSALLIALGGALGASVRWATFAALPTFHDFPVATFAINVVGSGILALVVVHGRTRFSRRPELADLLGVGFCGGLTTFSTFALEIAQLGRDDRLALAATYAVSSVVVGALVAWLVAQTELRRDRPVGMTTAIAFVVAAATGALARTALSQILNRPQGLPWGTLLVNASGSLLLALAVPLDGPLSTVLAVGAIGAYTTFSTFSLELVRLIEQEHPAVVLAYAVLSVGGCTALASIGLAV